MQLLRGLALLLQLVVEATAVQLAALLQALKEAAVYLVQ
jgi:uncharacterized membrane protein